jgi:very-short-patch-repair endonuclease
MQYYDPKLKSLSRELRNKSTLAEVLLWNQLQSNKMLGYTFHRQKPIYGYIVDFYCQRLELVIEIDGESHREQFQKDRAREEDLVQLGLQVLRFQDRDVKNDMKNVLNCIQNWIEQHGKKVVEEQRARLRHPPTPPSKGE